MALIRASIWGLLCVSCVCCLLFGNVAVDAEEDTQNGEAPDLTKKPLSGTPQATGLAIKPLSGTPQATDPAIKPLSGTPQATGPAINPLSGTPQATGPAINPLSGTLQATGPAINPRSGTPQATGPVPRRSMEDLLKDFNKGTKPKNSTLPTISKAINPLSGTPQATGPVPRRSMKDLLKDFDKRTKPKNSTLPTISKDGVIYYDIAGVQDAELVISKKNNHSVEGVTASHGECKVRTLRLESRYRLHEDLFTHCSHLHLTLTGKDWQCVKEGRMLKKLGVDVDMSQATCSDAWDDNTTHTVQTTSSRKVAWKYRMEEGIKKLNEFGITRCPDERCFCRWYFKEKNYIVSVICDGIGLTDDLLPIFPARVKSIRLLRNKLRSMNKLIHHLLFHHHDQLLELLALDDNQMTDLPRLPEGSFPRLIAIDLPRNRIKKIDLDAFKDLVSREHFIINLQGNPFQCDCPMYRFKDFLQHNCMANWKIFKSYINIECNNTHANENELIPLHKMAKDTCSATFDWSQVDTWLLLNIFLGVLNLFVIYLMIDLICIITHIGGKTQRRPVMDHVVCAVKSVLCCVCPLRRGNVKVN